MSEEKDAEALQGVTARIQATTARWGMGTTLEQIRADFEALMAGPCPARIEQTEIAGLPVSITVPDGALEGAIILYCHGGGFQIGSPRSHASMIARLAVAAGVAAIAPDYRLAPEHRFPAAHEDCFAAYCGLLEQGYAAHRIVVAGDSAGGSLAIGVALQARDAGLALPAGLALISPHLDLTLRGASYETRADKDIFSKPEQIRAMGRTYMGRGNDPAHPLASPVEADLAGLPPMLVHAGDFDVTLDDSTLLVARATAAGVACTLKVWPRMMHHFQAFAELPQAQASLGDMGAFIRSRLEA